MAVGDRGAELEALIGDPLFQRVFSNQDPDEFTFYEVIRMADCEIRHRNTLAWLFDGQNSRHNLGSSFLELFLLSLREHGNNRRLLEGKILDSPQGTQLVCPGNRPCRLVPGNYTVDREKDFIDVLGLLAKLLVNRGNVAMSCLEHAKKVVESMGHRIAHRGGFRLHPVKP